ncbi:diguanylate cyclase domain-containing protein [Pseudoduganella sp. OTU4001]|uniref:diguanylate cyclase domain-containing protein n=1 Tax=Pseudoduganella sp. OTU4001 TaxID=3043854 RepID=UPI00313B47CC
MSDRLDLPQSKLVALLDAQLELARIGPAFGNLMDCAVQKAAQLTGADGAVIELLEGTEVVYRAACGLAEAQLGLRMQVKGSLSGLVLTTRQAATCTDSETDERVNREACRRVGLRSMAIMPLLFGDQSGGVLKLAWRAPRPFDQDEVPVGQAIADMTAAMMFHASQEGASVLQRKVTQDPATGLANRSSFYEKLRVRLDDAIVRGGHVGVMVARVKPWRSEVMVELARRFAQECREGDVLARLGGDEFGVILSVAARRSVVQSQVLRFRQTAGSQAVLLPGGEKIEPVLQFGSALYPEDGAGISDLLARAREPGPA